MSEFVITRKTGLGLSASTTEEWEGFTIEELPSELKYWVSVRGDHQKLNNALKKAISCELPDTGRFNVGESSSNPWLIASAGSDQWFVTGGPGNLPAAIHKLAAITDQSDGWVGWRLSGNKVRAVFEKLIGLDLHAKSFPGGSAARSSIEGMMAILFCEDDRAGIFILYTQRSYARDFVEHIRHAAYSSCGERKQIRRDDD